MSRIVRLLRIGAFAGTLTLAAQAFADAPAGSVLLLSGQASAAGLNGTIRALAKGNPVYSGEILSTALNSFLNLKFSDGGYILMRPDSRFQVRDYVDTTQPQSQGRPWPRQAAVTVNCAAPEGRPPRLDGCAAGQLVLLGGIGFAPGQTSLTPAEKAQVGQLAATMREYSKLVVEIDSYTDNRGAAELNLRLSTARAAAVREELIAQGIAAERLSARGLGAQQPVADNGTLAGRFANRRIELRIVLAAGNAPSTATTGTPPAATVDNFGQMPFTSRPDAANANEPLAITPQQAGPGSHAFFSLLKGGFRAVSGAIGKIDHDQYQVTTPVATIGIRGTDYLAVLCDVNCAHDPIIDPLLPYDLNATGGVVFGDISGSILLTSAKGEYQMQPGQFVLVLPDGTFIPLPAMPHFLTVNPLPDPQNCLVPN